jgi:DNA ligase (NAD+)
LIKDSKELKCVNKECFETNLQKILAAVRNIGIEELGAPNIRKMMNVLGVKKLADIFKLTIDDILKLEGFKQKSATNLYNSIQRARNTADYQLLAALNIQGIGQTAASKILSDYTLDEIRKMSRIELAYIPEIGSELSEKLYSSLLEQSDTLDDMILVLNITPSKSRKKTNDLVCFDIEVGMTEKSLSHYEKLLKLNNLNRVKPVKEGGVLHLPEKLKVLVTTRKADSKNSLMLKAKEIGAEILSPEKWEASLVHKTGSAEHGKKTICFTGEMPEKRSYYEALAQKNGYNPVDTVTKELSLLVTENKNSESSKTKKAKSFGIEIITLDEWLNSINGVKIKKEDVLKENNDSFPDFGVKY